MRNDVETGIDNGRWVISKLSTVACVGLLAIFITLPFPFPFTLCGSSRSIDGEPRTGWKSL